MRFTVHKKTTPIPHSTGGGIQSFLRMLNMISLEISLSEKNITGAF